MCLLGGLKSVASIVCARKTEPHDAKGEDHATVVECGSRQEDHVDAHSPPRFLFVFSRRVTCRLDQWSRSNRSSRWRSALWPSLEHRMAVDYVLPA
jgi:hypothetical protein